MTAPTQEQIEAEIEKRLQRALEPFAAIEVPIDADDGTWVAKTIYCNNQVTAHSVREAKAALAAAEEAQSNFEKDRADIERLQKEIECLAAAAEVGDECQCDGCGELLSDDDAYCARCYAAALTVGRGSCKKCGGRGYVVYDAEWEPYAVQCPDCSTAAAKVGEPEKTAPHRFNNCEMG